jgi:putative heme-binding domain-containing protein
VKESREDAASPSALKRAYRPLLERLAMLDPGLAAVVAGGSDDDPKRWAEVLATVSWAEGNAQRGEATFRARCAACHTGFTALGPDLAGVAARFSREDLFRAIIFPNEDVAPTYRTTIFETRGGEVHVATVAYESAEGVILQTGAATTVRLAAGEIASRRPGTSSLMPTNLLTGLKPGELADLDATLRSLGKR